MQDMTNNTPQPRDRHGRFTNRFRPDSEVHLAGPGRGDGLDAGLTMEQLNRLRHNSDPEIRKQVAAHPHISRKALIELRLDPDPDVQAIARTNLLSEAPDMEAAASMAAQLRAMTFANRAARRA